MFKEESSRKDLKGRYYRKNQHKKIFMEGPAKKKACKRENAK